MAADVAICESEVEEEEEDDEEEEEDDDDENILETQTNPNTFEHVIGNVSSINPGPVNGPDKNKNTNKNKNKRKKSTTSTTARTGKEQRTS